MNLLNLLKKPKPVVLFSQENDQTFNITPDITPDNVLMAKTEKESGNYQHILSIFKKLIKSNDNLAANIDIRKEAAKTAEYKITSKLSSKQQLFFDEFLDCFLPSLIEQSIDLKLHGVAFYQILYTLENSLYKPIGFESYKNLDLRLKNKKMALFIDDIFKPLPEPNFIIKYKDECILESLLKYYCFFSFAINNWAQLTETYGKPVRIGKYSPGTSQKDVNILKQMITSLGTDLSAVLPENTGIEFIDFKNKSGSADIYKTLVSFVEDRETRRILGQTMSTKESEYGGYAQARIQNLVREDILLGDLREASTYVSDFLTRINHINFGSDRITVKLTPVRLIDTSKKIQIDRRLNQIINIDPEYFYKTYDIPEPKDGMKKKITSPAPLQAHLKTTNIINSSKYIEKGLQKVIKSAQILKKNIAALDKPEFPAFFTDLHLVLGAEINSAIIAEYKNDRLKPKNTINNIDIDWSLNDIQAINAFRAEAFEVAHVNADELRNKLKYEAEDAIRKGSTFNKWKNQMQLSGFEPENPYHLRTNFNTAANNASLASQWQNATSMKDTFPYLRYVAVMDDRVRDEHAELHDTVAHQNDEFWNEFYPPNGWNCRCGVEMMTNEEGAQKALKPKPWIPIDENFQKNTGKDLTVWGKWLDRKLKESGHYSWTDLNLSKWQDIPENKFKNLHDTSGKSHSQLLKEYADYLNDRVLSDPTGTPVALLKEKASKFKEHKLDDLAKRLKYMKNIDDTITKPNEIWLKQKRVRYIKKYDKGIILIADLAKDGSLEYFNIIASNKTRYINTQRSGILVYKK
jgi:SPP1 gp7 family putative phage head morphogenesis protein